MTSPRRHVAGVLVVSAIVVWLATISDAVTINPGRNPTTRLRRSKARRNMFVDLCSNSNFKHESCNDCIHTTDSINNETLKEDGGHCIYSCKGEDDCSCINEPPEEMMMMKPNVQNVNLN